MFLVECKRTMQQRLLHSNTVVLYSGVYFTYFVIYLLVYLSTYRRIYICVSIDIRYVSIYMQLHDTVDSFVWNWNRKHLSKDKFEPKLMAALKFHE